MKKGFTLIELLIVIAILGILAIGLMAALDPLEQLKRGRDTSTRNSVEEFYNAALRYYSTKERFPWGSTIQAGGIALTAMTGTYLQSLISAGELKARFLDDRNKLAKIYLTSTHADISGMRDDLTVCFIPESKAIRGENNSVFTRIGAVQAGCPTADYTSVSCYWCIK